MNPSVTQAIAPLPYIMVAPSGKLRVGFENSLWRRDGQFANNNAQRIAEVVSMIKPFA